MLYTNIDSHGGFFDDKFYQQLKESQRVRIASGYLSLDVLRRYESLLLEKAQKYQCQILLGMAFYEGISQEQLDNVSRINKKMLFMETNSGFFVAQGRKYHGKIFQINGKTYLGSSNFSSSGFKGNIEATVECTTEQEIKINLFLDSLFSDEHSIKVENARIPIKGKIKLADEGIESTWEQLRRYDINSIFTEIMFDSKVASYNLLEKATYCKSNLNAFFGKGRIDPKTKIIAPRPWYEFEMIASKKIWESKDYPEGSFIVYTDDGYIIPMLVSGTNSKNLRTKGGLQVFGRWFKGRLEDAGVLNKFNLITPDTILEYGKTQLNLYKMKSDGSYYMVWEN